jgi:hypothetical protein
VDRCFSGRYGRDRFLGVDDRHVQCFRCVAVGTVERASESDDFVADL